MATLTGQGNIIGNAENAVGKYNNSVASEQQLLNEIEKYFQNYLEVGNTETTEPTEPEIVESSDIANNPEEHFGGEVTNYTTPSGDPEVKWRIFYADEENVYLIADDYIRFDYAPRSTNYTLVKGSSEYRMAFVDSTLAFADEGVALDYKGASDITDSRVTKWLSYLEDNASSTNDNIRAVAFMLDTGVWSAKYANSEYAEYAVGGPTLELWCASYKATHDRYVECSYDDTGYLVKWSDSPSYSISGAEDDNNLYYITDTEHASYQWLASPSSFGSDRVVDVDNNGNVNSGHLAYSSVGFRPLVCLKSGIQLEKQNDGTYLIK